MYMEMNITDKDNASNVEYRHASSTKIDLSLSAITHLLTLSPSQFAKTVGITSAIKTRIYMQRKRLILSNFHLHTKLMSTDQPQKDIQTLD